MILPQSNMYQAVPYLAGTVYYAVGCRRSEFIPFRYFSPLISGRGPNGLFLFIPVLNSHFE